MASTILRQLEAGPATRGQITAHLRTVGSASRAAVRSGIGELLVGHFVDQSGQRKAARFSVSKPEE